MAFPTIDFDVADDDQVPTPGYGKSVQAVRFVASLGTGSLASAKVTKIGTLPAGFTILDGYVVATDMDTDASPALVVDIGVRDAETEIDDIDAIGDGETIGQAGGKVVGLEAAAVGLTTTYKTDVTVTAVTAAATAAAGTLTVELLGYFA